MLKLFSYLFLFSLVAISIIPAAMAAPINSTIQTPGTNFSYSANPVRSNDVTFSEFNLDKWDDISNIEDPKIQPILFPILMMIIFSFSLFAGLKIKESAIAGMFFLLTFVMCLVLLLVFMGNLEFGIITEETIATVDTSTGLFEISKTYNTHKMIPNDATFRPILTLVFQLLFFFSMITFIAKLFLIPLLEKRKNEKEKQN